MAATALLALAGAALTTGCGLNPQRLTLRDTHTNEADLQVSVRPAAWARRDSGPSRGFEAGAQQYRAEGPQPLATGETFSVGSAVINGPDVLLQKAKVSTWYLGFADRFYFGPAFELDIGAGGLRTDLDYELRPQSGAVGTQPFARSVTLPYGAITPRFRLGDHVALEGRVSVAGLTEDAQHRRYDATVVLRPLPQVALRLGYSDRRTRIVAYGDPLFSSVDLTVRARGPMAGLRIDF